MNFANHILTILVLSITLLFTCSPELQAKESTFESSEFIFKQADGVKTVHNQHTPTHTSSCANCHSPMHFRIFVCSVNEQTYPLLLDTFMFEKPNFFHPMIYLSKVWNPPDKPVF